MPDWPVGFIEISPHTMKIRIYGFSPDMKTFPSAMKLADVFNSIQENGGRAVDKKELVRISATMVPWVHDGENEEWWAGMIVRARDAKSFNRLKRTEDGRTILTSEDVGEGQLGEIGFFVAWPGTGSGLFAGYHHGPSFRELAWLSGKLFSKELSLRRTALHQRESEPTREEWNALKGKFALTRMSRTGDLRQLLGEFQKLKVFEVRYTEVRTEAPIFRKARTEAKTETEKFIFPEDFVLNDDLADEIVRDMDAPEIAGATIVGTVQSGAERRVSSEMARNKMIFGESDYDNLLAGLELDIGGDWSPAIRQSPIIQWMLGHANGDATRNLLITKKL